jgi:hypothetical protein
VLAEGLHLLHSLLVPFSGWCLIEQRYWRGVHALEEAPTDTDGICVTLRCSDWVKMSTYARRTPASSPPRTSDASCADPVVYQRRQWTVQNRLNSLTHTAADMGVCMLHLWPMST